MHPWLGTEITVGRHEAPDGAAVHPMIAAGLAGRAPRAAGAHREDRSAPSRQGGVGWPGPPAPGDGLGWPGERPADTGVEHPEEPPDPPRGWRRFFGRSRAA